MKDLIKVKDRHQRDIMTKKNVTGVGVGYKTTNGVKTDVLSIVILVEKKLPAAALEARDIVPRELEGIPTDVLEVGKFRTRDKPEKQRTDKWRPAPGGVSIGHYEITAGTLGIPVCDRKTGEELILSNNHVLANSNQAQIGDPILQPGPYDGGSEKDTIGELLRFEKITFAVDIPTCPIAVNTAKAVNFIFKTAKSHHQVVPVRANDTENTVDAAVALPLNEDLVRDEILDIGRITGTRKAELDITVEKSGRTTGHTSGTIDVIDTTATVAYGPGKIALFSHQALTSCLSQGGDSGSLVVSEEDAVGLLFAGSDSYSIFNPIDLVLKTLDIDI